MATTQGCQNSNTFPLGSDGLLMDGYVSGHGVAHAEGHGDTL